MRNLLLLLALIVFSQHLAFADALSPCQAGTLETIANTSCSIAGLDFTFGTAELGFSPVSFTPEAALSGFVLGGPVTLLQDPLGGAAELFSLPFLAATVNGQPLIFGITTSFTGSTTQDGVLQVGAHLCSANVVPCVLGGVSITPSSEVSGLVDVFMLVPDHLPGSATFTSASFQLEQVPEPGSFGLLMTGVICFAGLARKFARRSARE